MCNVRYYSFYLVGHPESHFWLTIGMGHISTLGYLISSTSKDLATVCCARSVARYAVLRIPTVPVLCNNRLMTPPSLGLTTNDQFTTEYSLFTSVWRTCYLISIRLQGTMSGVNTIHANQKPVEVSEGESDMITRFKVHYEVSSGVLYSLQWSNRLFRYWYAC